MLQYIFLLGSVAAMCNAAYDLPIKSVQDAYYALLAQAAQIRCSGLVAQAESQCARELRMIHNAYKGHYTSQALVSVNRINSKRVSAVSEARVSCYKALSELEVGCVERNPYFDRSILDLFAAKSKVGLDDLLLKAYKLHTAGYVEDKEAEEFMQQVSVALLEFDKQASKTVFDDLFPPLFRGDPAFKDLKKKLEGLCLASNILQGFEVLQAAFRLGEFVFNAQGVGTEGPESFEPHVLKEIKESEVSHDPLIIMRWRAGEYAEQAKLKQQEIYRVAELLQSRDCDLSSVRDRFQSYSELAKAGHYALEIIPLMTDIIEQTLEMTPISLSEAPGKGNVLQKHCEALKIMDKEINECVAKHKLDAVSQLQDAGWVFVGTSKNEIKS